MHNKTVRVRIYGTVQGVFFRHHTKLQAQALGLGGWVKNRSDGSVEAVIHGTEEDVERMIAWLHQGPESAHVIRVDIEEKGGEQPLLDLFTIRY
ncbi:MAG: acylphosphatase [Desulfofustis sp.]